MDAIVAWLRELAAGTFETPYKRDRLEHAHSHIECIQERAKELLATLDAQP